MSLNQLSRREIEIAKLLFQGHKPKAISQTLKLSRNTVKTHVSWVYKKLGVKSQKQMLSFYSIGDLAA